MYDLIQELNVLIPQIQDENGGKQVGIVLLIRALLTFATLAGSIPQ